MVTPTNWQLNLNLDHSWSCRKHFPQTGPCISQSTNYQIYFKDTVIPSKNFYRNMEPTEHLNNNTKNMAGSSTKHTHDSTRQIILRMSQESGCIKLWPHQHINRHFIEHVEGWRCTTAPPSIGWSCSTVLHGLPSRLRHKRAAAYQEGTGWQPTWRSMVAGGRRRPWRSTFAWAPKSSWSSAVGCALGIGGVEDGESVGGQRATLGLVGLAAPAPRNRSIEQGQQWHRKNKQLVL